LAKTALFRELGYVQVSFGLLEGCLQRAGLRRPDKSFIDSTKQDRIAKVLGDSFLRACNRGDCQQRARGAALVQRKSVVSAERPEHCAVCHGGPTARAVDAMVDALSAAGLSRLCVVRGSPSTHDALRGQIGQRVELKCIDGTSNVDAKAAAADAKWAHVVAIWAPAILKHRVSNHFPVDGQEVVRVNSRSLAGLATAVTAAALRGAPATGRVPVDVQPRAAGPDSASTRQTQNADNRRNRRKRS
jgi:hypothetical protein